MKIKKQCIFYSFLLCILVILAFIISYNNAAKSLKLNQFNIQQLSSERIVLSYIKKYHSLPEYYIKKKEARNAGWSPGKNNLCEILPGKIIGGDVFTDRENKMPKKIGRRWFEADLNYNCGNRGTDRIIFSDDGLIFVTYDHYNTFEQR